MDAKYESQIKHLRSKYVRFSLDLKPDLLERYRAACAAQGTNATAEIKKFIAEYCEKYAPEE